MKAVKNTIQDYWKGMVPMILLCSICFVATLLKKNCYYPRFFSFPFSFILYYTACSQHFLAFPLLPAVLFFSSFLASFLFFSAPFSLLLLFLRPPYDLSTSRF